MTMRKVRQKKIRRELRLETISRLSKKRVDRVTSAINATWTIREEPEYVQRLKTERQCLRAEITAITIEELGKKNTNASNLIAARLKRIDIITQQLTERRNSHD